MINWNLAGNPVNWLVVASMALIGLLVAAFVSAPLRNAAAQ